MKISKRTAKIINIILIVVAILLLVSNFSLATDVGQYKDLKADNSALRVSVSETARSILGIVQAVGMAVAVIMLIVVGIKYISASPNEKASLKKNLVVYIVGAVILFAASGLVGLIRTWSGTIK